MQCTEKELTHTYSPIDTSLISSAAACPPCTSARVHDDRSQVVSTRNTWDSMPRPVPVRVANTNSAPWAGALRALPEWTSLGRKDRETTHRSGRERREGWGDGDRGGVRERHTETERDRGTW